LYDQGLELPEDMTLVWANDNFGHMRRYPNEAERSRKGGNGLYFHSSYWAHPGSAMSYLFINSTPLAHTGNELRKSYASGIRKLWVLNIGGLKPVEQDMEYFLRYGWEADKETGITKDASAFTRHWIDANFTGQHGEEAAELYESFAQITNVRKIEHMNSDVFSQTAYGDEAGRRLAQLEEIFNRGNAILESLPAEERDAFFQLFLMKIHASYFTNLEFYYGDRSVLSCERGNMQAADEYSELSARMLDCKRSMIHFYNKIMSGGKWDGIMTPENFPPPPTAMFPARKPALRIEGSGLRVSLWNEAEVLLFSPCGRRQKWIELGNQGAGSIPFSITVEGAGSEWITVSEAEGIVQTEKRILVTVDDPANYSGKEAVITVHDQRNGAAVSIPVRVEEAVALPEGFSGYVESDGAVSIPAAEFARSSVTGGPVWVTVPGLGRHEGAAVMAWLPDLHPLEGELAEQPRLKYDFFLRHEGSHMLEIHRNLTLNSTGRIRFGIGVDGHTPIMVESETRDEWTGQWKDSVFNNGEKLAVQLPALSAGAHSLKLFMVDPYVTVSKLVLYTSARKATQLGPVPSTHTEVPAVEYGTEGPVLDLAGLDRLCREFYRTESGDIPLPDALYVSPAYNRIKDITFIPVEKVPQQKLGAARYAELGKAGGPKDIIREFGSGNFMESGGIVAIEAEYALANTAGAYLTDAADGSGLSWSHLQAETNGHTGFAMHVAPPGILWENPEAAPGMHYRVNISAPGQYRVWLHMRHYNNQSDSCYLALDGAARPLEEQPRKGNHHTYNTAYVYYWCFLSKLELSAGEHVLSILARKSQLRVDRIYLTLGDELPPADAEWKDSARRA
ncbi:MAG: hypothetical protein K0Q90_4625, partial [Paenibacillaceae bacterium]|nr:hypothetical protein [Paenibacillaceae bacterium]